MPWLVDALSLKARLGPRDVWHRIDISSLPNPRTNADKAAYADCGIRLDYDLNTINLRLEVVGWKRAVPGQHCKRCHWEGAPLRLGFF